MKRLNCNHEWLLDYADDTLAIDQRVAADAHLAGCPACRRQLQALRTSGELLTAYFRPEIAPPQETMPARRSRQAVIASGMALAAALLVAITLPRMERSQRPGTERILGAMRPAAIDLADAQAIEAELQREAQIARLRAAHAILNREPGLKERSKALEKYLADIYGVNIADTGSSL